ncbi:pentatricopeptide repeat-containing protein [Cucumis melo var. makuwa]|uniref:Pentatricopeptide repeat-containing protein At4g32430, mitochondrial n=2 Tax=Cucumis melo TaxID=3656 RepID=A0A1S3BA52_CUCME|nr:pentatricopeptide repeat-containing protein At4g32430, mitochondrial [Cucumis melo]KAA0046793.1 pentatricopeptide repeat-containing protein [Cucumis melo var. makuwa]
MLTRHLNFNSFHVKSKQRFPSFKIFRSFHHDYNLFDQSPTSNAASFNRVLLNYLSRDGAFQSLRFFKKNFRWGLDGNTDEFTLALALKACCGLPKLGRQIHGFVISSGFFSHITVSNSLMNMYCKSGQLERAFSVFENLHDPDIVSWNTILSGFEKSENALSFALRMNLNGVKFDSVTYTTALSFCLDIEDFLFGWQLHSLALKCGLESDVFVGNALVTMYSRCEHLVDARKVFDEMPSRDRVSWSAMITGYAQEGDNGLQAILVFVQMVREGVKFDNVPITGALSVCGHERNLELGKQIHCLAVKTGHETHTSVGNVLISTYSKCEIIEDAKAVFELINDRNVISWTTMISLYEEGAVSLFNKMRLDGVYPNDVTFIGLLHAITIRNMVEQGLMVHGLCIKADFVSELTVGNSLITMYAKFEFMQDASRVFMELPYREIISWNALISGYAQNALCQEALEAFFYAIMEYKPNEYTFGSVLNAISAGEDISLKHGQRCHSHLIKVGLNFDPIISGALLDMYAKRGSIQESQRVFNETSKQSQFAWTALISGYAQHGDYESVIKLFEEMEKEKIKPDAVIFLSVLTACSRNRMVNMGRQLFDMMIKDHMIEPEGEHYSCMVDMLGRAGRLEEAEEILASIPGGPGISALQSLLGACRTHGNVEMAERIANDLMKKEPLESGPYVLMSNLYAQKGDWEKVAEMRKEMRERGVKKEIGFSWVDVGNFGASNLYLHGFSSGDVSHPQSEEIFRMAKYMGAEMKFLKDRARESHISVIGELTLTDLFVLDG